MRKKHRFNECNLHHGICEECAQKKKTPVSATMQKNKRKSDKRIALLREVGIVMTEMWECQWKTIRSSLKQLPNVPNFPVVEGEKMGESEMLDQIVKGVVKGLVVSFKIHCTVFSIYFQERKRGS